MLVHKGGKIKNWGGECRDVTPTKLQSQNIFKESTVGQGLDKYCPAGKFQWKMPDNAGTANTPEITEVANTGIYEQN